MPAGRPPAPPKEKLCWTCQKIQPIAEFWEDEKDNTARRFASSCHACMRADPELLPKGVMVTPDGEVRNRKERHAFRPPGRPRKYSGERKTPGKVNREGLEKMICEINHKNKTWLSQKVEAHWSSYGQVLDDIIDCLRAGLPVEIKTYTPGYIQRAKKAEMARRERLARLEVQKAKREISSKQGDVPDDGGPNIDV